MNAAHGPVSASLVEDEVAARPRGGKRRANTAVRIGACAPADGRRANRGIEARLIDAADAADHLARNQTFWTSTQILGHPEIARLAVVEARRELIADGHRAHRGLRGRLARRAMRRHIFELQRAADLLNEAHRENLLQAD